MHEEDLIDFTPELRQQAREIVRQYDHGPLYTPPSERGTILMPGIAGALSWSGAGWDPETQMYYVTTVRSHAVIRLERLSGQRSDVYVGRPQFGPGPQGLQTPRQATFTQGRPVWDLANLEPKLYAYDKASGRLLAEVVLPANASGAPMTYMAGGKQFVVFPVGGASILEELIALALP